MWRLLLVTGLLVAAAGCTSAESGLPTAGDGPASTTTISTTTSQGRPREIDLASVDVCSLLVKLPLPTFGLDQRPPLGGSSTTFPGAQDCFANGIDANLALTLTAVADQSAEEYAGGATATEVDGFALYVLKGATPDTCFGALDVADGQMLHVNYGLSAPTGNPATPQETLCARVPAIASATLVNL